MKQFSVPVSLASYLIFTGLSLDSAKLKQLKDYLNKNYHLHIRKNHQRR